MDRVDVKQEIPAPSKRIIYEILRTGYNVLADARILAPMKIPRSVDEGNQLMESNAFFDESLPSHDKILLHFWNPSSVPMRLLGIAAKAEVSASCRNPRHF
jgi:hypothetical protein